MKASGRSSNANAIFSLRRGRRFQFKRELERGFKAREWDLLTKFQALRFRNHRPRWVIFTFRKRTVQSWWGINLRVPSLPRVAFTAYSVYAVKTFVSAGYMRLRVLTLDSGVLIRELYQLLILRSRTRRRGRRIVRDRWLCSCYDRCDVPACVCEAVPRFALPRLLPILQWGWERRIAFF